ncbi:hypothetical protein EVAR_61166_1 [Eumeta japonica]|uniref:Uncharacterized protein n=1 Tax=Eumeta variegata TaxID=151549 RepID=A0A4C1ZQ80_EUMVA|nr:hypothetical protein EVAR_61166_1 [Eumeta japonica]
MKLISEVNLGGESDNLLATEVSSRDGSERTFRGLRMKWCGRGASYDTADYNNGFGRFAATSKNFFNISCMYLEIVESSRSL